MDFIHRLYRRALYRRANSLAHCANKIDYILTVPYSQVMAITIRDLIADLIEAGFVKTQFGKGSHRRFKHPCGISATVPGKDRDQALSYLIKQIRLKIEEAKAKGE